MSKKITRKGAGRTKGSFCFTPMSAREMLTLNPNQEFKWLVSSKQAKALGASIVSASVVDLNKTMGQSSPLATPEVKVMEF